MEPDDLNKTKKPEIIKIPNEKQLEQMIMKEEEIRMSDEYRQMCTDVKDEVNGWLRVTKEMQQRLVRDFGFSQDIECDIACNYMRRAHLLYPNNEIFKTVPLQVRNNRAKQGNLRVNDPVKNILLYDLTNNPINMHNILTNKPNIIMLGSHT